MRTWKINSKYHLNNKISNLYNKVFGITCNTMCHCDQRYEIYFYNLMITNEHENYYVNQNI